MSMLESRALHRPALQFRTSRANLAQASAWTRLLLIAPVLVLIWVILGFLVRA
ncbi:MAG: hypothetical protein MO846_01075 [Candidatus Devosia symbiotica]|nr:hypothetical protein [Candidatus Devosia symbiotica]